MKKNMRIIEVLFCFIILLNLTNLVSAETTNYDIINLDATIFNYNPTPAVAGSTFELWIQLNNNSNLTATNVKYLLDLEYPFSISDFNNNEETINKIAPHQTVIIKYEIKVAEEALNKTYELKFKFKRDGVDSYSIQKYNIDVEGDQALVDIISSNIRPTNIGGQAIFDLTIKNLGKKKAKNIFVTINDSSDNFVKIIGLKTVYIPNLSIGNETTIKFKANVSNDAENKIYTLPINITYSDSDSNYSTNRNIGLELIDNPKMIINVVSIGKYEIGKLISNKEEKIELEIYNIGNIDAESVYVEAIGEDVSNNFGKYFIGSIEKDNYDSVTLEFQTKDISPEVYPLTIILHYKDSKLQEKTITKMIDVSVDNDSKKHNLIFMILSSIGYFILFIIGLSIFIIIIKWIFKKIVKPTYEGLFKSINKKKRK